MFLEQRAHRSSVETAIALGTRRPYRRALAAIQHSELQHGKIGRASHNATERIDFTNYRSFRDAADRRIARHLTDRLERGRDDAYTRAKSRGSNRRLCSGVTTTDDNDVEVCFVRARYRRCHISKVH